jgi:hypothetical protein
MGPDINTWIRIAGSCGPMVQVLRRTGNGGDAPGWQGAAFAEATVGDVQKETVPASRDAAR